MQSYYTYTIHIIIQHRTRPDQTRPANFHNLPRGKWKGEKEKKEEPPCPYQIIITESVSQGGCREAL